MFVSAFSALWGIHTNTQNDHDADATPATPEDASLPKECLKSFSATFYGQKTHGAQSKKFLLGEIHSGAPNSNVKKIDACVRALGALATPQGGTAHLEVADVGHAIPCDRTLGSVTCFGFDEPKVSTQRIAYHVDGANANNVAKLSLAIDSGQLSPEKLPTALQGLASQLKSLSPRGTPKERQFYQKQADYFQGLATQIKRMPVKNLQKFLRDENNRLANSADTAELNSRKGPTNERLVARMRKQGQLPSIHFFVAGDRHVDQRHNLALAEYLHAEEVPPTVVLRPMD